MEPTPPNQQPQQPPASPAQRTYRRATPSDVFFLHPTEAGWALGDHGATCLLTPQ